MKTLFVLLIASLTIQIHLLGASSSQSSSHPRGLTHQVFLAKKLVTDHVKPGRSSALSRRFCGLSRAEFLAQSHKVLSPKIFGVPVYKRKKGLTRADFAAGRGCFTFPKGKLRSPGLLETVFKPSLVDSGHLYNDVCPIDLEQFNHGEQITLLVWCGHAFRAEYNDGFETSGSVCPTCKMSYARADAPALAAQAAPVFDREAFMSGIEMRLSHDVRLILTGMSDIDLEIFATHFSHAPVDLADEVKARQILGGMGYDVNEDAGDDLEEGAEAEAGDDDFDDAQTPFDNLTKEQQQCVILHVLTNAIGRHPRAFTQEELDLILIDFQPEAEALPEEADV